MGWDSISQGKPSIETSGIEMYEESQPSTSSGAIPKKSVNEVTIKLNKKNSKQVRKSEEISPRTEFTVLKKKDETLDSDERSSLSAEDLKCKKSSAKSHSSSQQTRKIVLEEVNLGQLGLSYHSSSEDDSPPPSPRPKQTGFDFLNETFESDVDLEVGI